MIRLLLVLTIFSLSATSQAQNTLKEFFKDADAFFENNVAYNKIKYRQVKENPRSLNRLVRFISRAKLDGKSKAEKKAFFINTYNLLVIKGVIDNYPMEDPTKVDGFFNKKKYTVCGTSYTLDDLEFKEIFKRYNDPRLHFVLVCAAISCPPIANYAYMPDRLEEQLDERTRQSINNVVFIIYDEMKGKASISEIFKWYNKAFEPDLLTFINKYRKEPLPEDITLDYYKYNWSLNDASAYKR